MERNVSNQDLQSLRQDVKEDEYKGPERRKAHFSYVPENMERRENKEKK